MGTGDLSGLPRVSLGAVKGDTSPHLSRWPPPVSKGRFGPISGQWVLCRHRPVTFFSEPLGPRQCTWVNIQVLRLIVVSMELPLTCGPVLPQPCGPHPHGLQLALPLPLFPRPVFKP